MGDRPWPRFLGENFDGTVHSDLDFDWSQRPTLLWSLEVGEGYGIGTVADGQYFHFDAVPAANRFGIEERLRSFDLEDGSQRWVHQQPVTYRDMYGYEDGPRSSATIDGDQVFTLGVSGNLTCRDLATGEQQWVVDTSKQYGVVQNFFGVGSSPLVVEDQVIVMVGGSPPEDQNVGPGQLDRVISNGTAVVSFDRQSGKERWHCGDDLASYSSPRTMRVGEETFVLVFARGGLLAIDPKIGKVRWRFDHRASILESVNAIVPVVEGNHVFISECYEVGSAVLSVDTDSAKVVWQDPPRNRRAQAMRCHWSTPVLVDGFLYGCSGRNAPDSDFRCVDFKTGEVQWSDPRRIRSSVTRVGDYLVLLEERGAVQIIRPNPDRLEVIAEWNFSIPAEDRPPIVYPCWAAPVVVGDKLLIRGDQNVLCLQLATH